MSDRISVSVTTLQRNFPIMLYGLLFSLLLDAKVEEYLERQQSGVVTTLLALLIALDYVMKYSSPKNLLD